MKSAGPYLVSLIFILLLIVPGIGQDVVNSGVEGQDEVDEELFPEDSSKTFPADTLGAVFTDSLQSESNEQGNLLQSLVKPAVLTALIGGVLYLIFTQRGR